MSRPDDGANPVLVEPVRQRLVQIAADVVGRLPAEDVPASLRAIARFTPAKRVRLGAPALAAALDADEVFRAHVADAVVAATPQLVDALRSGAATPASDPIDTAVVAYLVRPEGWVEVVSGIAAAWAGERAGRSAASEEVARLRAEVGELRTRLKGEAARAAVASAAASATSSATAAEEATRLRNTLRTRTNELRAAEQALAAARAEVAVVRAEAAQAVAAAESETRRARVRVGELEQALESARRETRVARDLDGVRLRLLVDTLTDAAAGIRRELALPPGSIRPADAVVVGTMADGTASGGGAGSDGSGEAADPAALGRLLELPQVHVIVDGYNVTKTGYPDLPLADQRTRLITSMAALRSRTGAELTVVFDGGARPPVQPRAPRGVRVAFSAPGEPADDLIRQLVAAEPAGRPIVVVTSDQQVVRDVRRAGAWTVASAVLLARST